MKTLVSQHAAYLGGRIHEVAYDFYAQDDAGAVKDFGEDVFNFGDGVIVDTHGTWIAGKRRPGRDDHACRPARGDVLPTREHPQFVFEEVTVEVDRT